MAAVNFANKSTVTIKLCSISREIAERREAQEKFFSEVRLHRLGNDFRAQTLHIAERLQTRSFPFVEDGPQYESDALELLEELKAIQAKRVGPFAHSPRG